MLLDHPPADLKPAPAPAEASVAWAVDPARLSVRRRFAVIVGSSVLLWGGIALAFHAAIG